MKYMMTAKVVERLVKKARHLLAGDVSGKSGQRIFPGYFAFELPARPSWWSDSLILPEWGNVLGVHEVEPAAARAFVVTDQGLAVLNDPKAPVWVPYGAVVGWNKLEKDGAERTLVLNTTDQQTVELHFQTLGQAFAFVQFVGYATERLHIDGLSDPERP